MASRESVREVCTLDWLATTSFGVGRRAPKTPGSPRRATWGYSAQRPWRCPPEDSPKAHRAHRSRGGFFGSGTPKVFCKLAQGCPSAGYLGKTRRFVNPTGVVESMPTTPHRKPNTLRRKPTRPRRTCNHALPGAQSSISRMATLRGRCGGVSRPPLEGFRGLWRFPRRC